MWSVTLSGDVNTAEATSAAGDEQSLRDDLAAVVAKHADKISFAEASFAFSGTEDLGLASAQGDPSAPPAGSGDTPAPDAGSPAPDAGTPDPGTPDVGTDPVG